MRSMQALQQHASMTRAEGSATGMGVASLPALTIVSDGEYIQVFWCWNAVIGVAIERRRTGAIGKRNRVESEGGRGNGSPARIMSLPACQAALHHIFNKPPHIGQSLQD